MKELQIVGKMPPALKRELEKMLQVKDRTRLRKMLAGAMRGSVENTMRMAVLVCQSEELGDDLSDLEMDNLPQLRKVGYGQILPELLFRVQCRPGLLKRASALPLPDQRKIAEGEPIKVMEPGGDHHMVPPLKLTRAEVLQVFGTDCIRDEAEQASYLRAQAQKPSTKPLPKDQEIIVDRKRGVIRIPADTLLSVTQLAHYIEVLTVAKTNARLRA